MKGCHPIEHDLHLSEPDWAQEQSKDRKPKIATHNAAAPVGYKIWCDVAILRWFFYTYLIENKFNKTQI